MQLVVEAYLVLVALLLGSFINLALDRLPRRESLVAPRSHCRSCGRVLNPVDLMPVLGYALRGGRCATCRVAIGATAPAVEAACGLLMVAALVGLGLWPGAVAGLAAVSLLGITLTTLALRGGGAGAFRSPESRSGTTNSAAHRPR